VKIETVPKRDPIAAPEAAVANVAPTERGGKSLPQSGQTLPDLAPRAVQQATEAINRYLREAGHQLTFSVDDASGRTVVSVRDCATGDLIRQFSSEEALRIARHLDSIGAVLLQERA
jgi:flagellar protein FlaG